VTKASKKFAPVPEFYEALLGWYGANCRDLPWRRRQDDAYAIWISEIMLQQTTVAAVVGFYERWMERFPTIEALAAAPVDELLRYWSGLGYYARAHNIKRTAEIVTEKYGGRLPASTVELMELPGIGPYAAGAIASIAYNQDKPALDVNIRRVLTRLAMIEPFDAAKKSSSVPPLLALAYKMVPCGRARDYNQAMMELGALLCSVRDPSCDACPVRDWCQAAINGAQDRYPPPPRKTQWEAARHVAVAVMKDGKVLVVKRPPGAVWAGLWELPRVVVADDESLEQAAKRAVLETAGLQIELGEAFGTVKHVVMHTKIVLRGFCGTPASGALSASADMELAWLDPDGLEMYALSSPQKNLIRQWRDSRGQQSLGL
jgi:A/G-specific adenine glycosylase